MTGDESRVEYLSAENMSEQAKALFDLEHEEVMQGEINAALEKEQENIRVFNDWYAISNTMSDPAYFPRFDVYPPQEVIDYYNEVGVFDHVPEPAYYK